jgi:release factor glutamine methyltransferase
MSINEWLKQAQNQLISAGVVTARLDCLVLLEDCLSKDRAQILAHPELELSLIELDLLTKLIERRVQHEPLAYIRGNTEFYGRNFMVDHRVLEPRPESETIIELLKSLQLPKEPHIVDVGTGSGMLAITAKLEIPEAVVTAIDIDAGCLAVAAENCKKYRLDIALLKSDLLNKYQGEADVLLCNLPYVPDNFPINQAAQHEPRLAIFGGPDGLDLYRKLFTQLSEMPQYILAESLPTQHAGLAQIAKEHGYKLARMDDFIQLFAL